MPLPRGDDLFPADHTPTDGFVGSDACRRCHAGIVEEYAEHPMSQSLATVLDASVIEDYDNARFSTGEQVSYYVERMDEGVRHHERCVDAAGEEIYDQAVPVHVAVGSGIRGRSYLTLDNGRLKESPISWYSESETWGLSPGYPQTNHLRFDRQVSHACLSCHAGRVEPVPEHDDRFAGTVFHEHAIGCERCHGPGRDHIAFRESDDRLSDAIDTVVNPAVFHDARRDAVCNQCHLPGERRVVRAGRTEFDFRPGEYLSDNWIVFVKSFLDAENVAPAVSQVEQMHLSRCYQDSDGNLSCICCHDPHRTPAPDERISFYRDRCMACHSSDNTECSENPAVRRQRTPDDSCIACHMPSVPATDVHAAQTDHRVLRQPGADRGAATQRAESADESELLRLFREPGVSVPGPVLDRARGIRMAELAYFSGATELAPEAARLLLPVLDRARHDVEGRVAIGEAFSAMKEYELARQAWQQVLTLVPNHEKALEYSTITWMLQDEHARARPLLEQLVQVHPTRSHYFGRLAHVLGLTGDLRLSAAAAERALELNPSLFQTHQWLVDVYRRLNNDAAAAAHAAKLDQFRSTLSTGATRETGVPANEEP